MVTDSLLKTHDMRFADWTRTMSRSVLRQMIAVVSQPGILSFAGGLPAPEFFPTDEYAQAIAHVLRMDGRSLQYNPPFQPLKTHIVHLMAQRGVLCDEEQVFLTTGAQQGLDVLTRMLLNPGGSVIYEELVYTGLQQVVAPLQPEILAVGTDLATGIDVDGVEGYLIDGSRPAFLYLITDAHNPLGVSISPEKRNRLVELARQYGLPLIEDDPYGFLSYDGDLVRPLRALDDEWVFYLGSFSKIVAPALRLGWLIAPKAIIPKLTVVKEASDLESSGLTQRAVSAYLDAGHLPAHLNQLRTEYGRRRDAMLTALDRYFPHEARWTRPAGGMFIWVELPETINTTDLLTLTVEEEKVAFIPGHAFAIPGHQVTNCLRLNFSNCSPQKIEDGIQRIAKIIHRLL